MSDRPHVPFPWRARDFPRPGTLFRLGRLLAREPEYAALWRKTHDIDALERAGFIDDGLDHKQCTDLGVLGGFSQAKQAWITALPDPAQLARIPNDQPLVVLLATGSFAPLHEGHLAMLAAATAALEKQGLCPLASYLSPSHDLYVQDKDGGRCAAYPANLRLDIASRLVASSDPSTPCFVDPWESLVAPRPVNFTTVLSRLETYLSHHLDRPVHAIYVFGADNAGFANVFTPSASGIPRAVCVARPGHTPQSNQAVLSAHLAHPGSSTRVRRSPIKHEARPAKGDYLFRNDGDFCLSHWKDKVGTEPLEVAWADFTAKATAIIEGAFVDQPGPSRFRMVDLTSQRRRMSKLLGQGPVISLDACTGDLPGVMEWPVSRRFRVADIQISPHDRGPRPGRNLPSVLPPQALLVDDDTATGQSLAAARSTLEEMGVQITGTELLSEQNFNLFDVVDLRDFLPGSREGGLVVQLPKGEVCRVPYMAPFVNLNTRARLPDGTSWAASTRIWNAAAEFFEALPIVLTVADMDPSQRACFLAQGVPESLALFELCCAYSTLVNTSLRPEALRRKPLPAQF